VKVNTASLKIISSTKTDVCTTQYVSDVIVSRMYKQKIINSTIIPALDFDKCIRAVEGRPFNDFDGNQLQANAVISDNQCWSKIDQEGNKDTQTIQLRKSLDNEENDFVYHKENSHQVDDLASDWTHRSLGEHASVASFAAFTISLMTNNAPPGLIVDSLRAALDEVDHATASFEAVFKLTGETVEPGPLPPSVHKFDTNIGTLMRNTVKEGCIDETLSALAAAAEADMYGSCNKNDCTIETMLHIKLVKIAMDESRHSALAWRTIHWGCEIDSLACEKEVHFPQVTKLSDELKNTYPSFHARIIVEWERIYDNLLPYVTNRGLEIKDECKSHILKMEKGRVNDSILGKVTDSVLCQVLCNSATLCSDTGTTAYIDQK